MQGRSPASAAPNNLKIFKKFLEFLGDDPPCDEGALREGLTRIHKVSGIVGTLWIKGRAAGGRGGAPLVTLMTMRKF